MRGVRYLVLRLGTASAMIVGLVCREIFGGGAVRASISGRIFSFRMWRPRRFAYFYYDIRPEHRPKYEMGSLSSEDSATAVSRLTPVSSQSSDHGRVRLKIYF